METNLNNNEEKLFDLIESKGWQELTLEERNFVLEQISMEDYMLQREILVQAETLYEASEPLPLVIPGVAKPFIQRSIPLYQAMAAVAAVILVFLLIRPTSNTEIIEVSGKSENVPQQAKSETEYIRDTIVRYVTVVQKSTESIVDTVQEFVAFPQAEEPRLLEATTNLSVQELNSEKLETRGTSLKDDKTSQLAPRIVNTIY